MENDFNIVVPDGYEIDENDSDINRIVLKKKKVLPSSWEEIENLNGFFFNEDGEIEYSESVTHTETVFSYLNEAKSVEALAKLTQLINIYHEVSDYNYTDTNKISYAICFDYREEKKFKVKEVTTERSLLIFPTRETAQYFLNNFRSIIEKASALLFGV